MAVVDLVLDLVSDSDIGSAKDLVDPVVKSYNLYELQPKSVNIETGMRLSMV